MTGKFIVLEGLDGAGTTTQTQLLSAALREKGFKVATTCEPSSSSVGRFLREILSSKDTSFTAEALALLFTADRLQHVREVIKPALAENDYLICDRYYHSTLAYQLNSQANNLDWLLTLNQPALKPTLTFFLDVSAETALARLNTAKRQRELFETSQQLKRIHRNYQLVITHLRNNAAAIIILDGEAAAASILDAELKILAGI